MRKGVDTRYNYYTWVPAEAAGAEHKKLKNINGNNEECIVPSGRLIVSEVIIDSEIVGEECSYTVIPLDVDYKDKVLARSWDLYKYEEDCVASEGIMDVQGVYKIKESRKILKLISEELDHINPGNELDIIYGELNNLYEETIGRVD